MIAILAAGEDAGALALASLLRETGLPNAVVTAFDDLDWHLRISRDAQPDTTLHLRTGEEVTGLIVRSLPVDDDGFVGAEQSAAWWALAGSFAGRVVGRPTGGGVATTIDRLRIDGEPVWQGRWALRGPASARSPRHPHGGCARPGADGGVAEFTAAVEARDEVVDITPCEPHSLRRLIVAGYRVLASSAADPLDEHALDWVTEAVASALPGLFGLVIDPDSREVLDVGPVTHPLLASELGPRIAAGVKEALA